MQCSFTSNCFRSSIVKFLLEMRKHNLFEIQPIDLFATILKVRPRLNYANTLCDKRMIRARLICKQQFIEHIFEEY